MRFCFCLLVLIPTILAETRVQRSAAISNLSEQTSNILGDLIAAINPVYVVILGILVAAGCAFEIVHGSRSSKSTRANHVASKCAPYSA